MTRPATSGSSRQAASRRLGALRTTPRGLVRTRRWASTEPALASEGFGSFAVPTLSLAVVLALGALVGVLAAAHPARRAARMNVLSAIATE